MRKIILTLFVFSCFSCQSAPEGRISGVNCLEREWQDIGDVNLSSVEKSFDVANDKDQHGGSFSCISYSTPHEINQFLGRLKSAVKNKNVNMLEPLIHFPFVLIHEREIKGEKAKTTVIKNMKEFTQLYEKVFYPEMEKLVDCISLDNLATSPSSGIDAAYGSLIFTRYAESRKLFLTSISMDKKPLNKWLNKFCPI